MNPLRQRVARHRGPLPGYAPAQDDRYEFSGTALRCPLAISRDAWRVEALPEGIASALVGVRVRAARGLPGRPPWFELQGAAGTSARHHLDRGSNGLRWFDISGVLSAATPMNSWQLRSQGVCFEGPAELVAYKDPLAGSRRILVVAPHPDDAEIAAFGLYKNHDSAVITITAGDAGGENYRRFHDDERAQFDLKRRLRLWDSLSVPLWAGLAPDRVATLGYFDETLSEMRASPTSRVRARKTGDTELSGQRRAFDESWLRQGGEPSWTSLVADLVHAICKFQPTTVVAPHLQLDAHPDHQASTFAVLEAVESLPARHALKELFFYINHPAYCSDWPFGPPSGDSSLPPWPRTQMAIPGLYSFGLSTADQIDKLFALEAMHDLRRAPPSITSRRDWGLMAALWAARDTYLRHNVGQSSYLRRAVRAREVFVAHPAADAARLRSEARYPSY